MTTSKGLAGKGGGIRLRLGLRLRLRLGLRLGLRLRLGGLELGRV